MASVTTTKPLDLDVLAAALGGGLSVVARSNGTESVVETDDATQAELESAIESHVAPDRSAWPANATAIRDKATAALDANKTFLALNNPTAAQNAAQVKALTRQVNALVRLALGRFDATD